MSAHTMRSLKNTHKILQACYSSSLTHGFLPTWPLPSLRQSFPYQSHSSDPRAVLCPFGELPHTSLRCQHLSYYHSFRKQNFASCFELIISYFFQGDSETQSSLTECGQLCGPAKPPPGSKTRQGMLSKAARKLGFYPIMREKMQEACFLKPPFD